MDEREVAPVPPKAIDDALADLMKNLVDIRPKGGLLDTKQLEKDLREQLQNLKPPQKLKVTTSGSGRLVDPKDTGVYWQGLQIDFGGSDKQYVWEKRLEVDPRKYALSIQPLYELTYDMVYQHPENTASQPFGRTMRLIADYRIVAKFTLTFRPDGMADGTGRTRAGVGAANPEHRELTGTVSVADRVER